MNGDAPADPDTGNTVALSGQLVEMDALRRTPAGIPILKFRIAHESVQAEAGTPRQVNCEVHAVAFEREATMLATAPLGSRIRVTGFLDRKTRASGTLVLHATRIEFKNI